MIKNLVSVYCVSLDAAVTFEWNDSAEWDKIQRPSLSAALPSELKTCPTNWTVRDIFGLGRFLASSRISTHSEPLLQVNRPTLQTRRPPRCPKRDTLVLLENYWIVFIIQSLLGSWWNIWLLVWSLLIHLGSGDPPTYFFTAKAVFGVVLHDFLSPVTLLYPLYFGSPRA